MSSSIAIIQDDFRWWQHQHEICDWFFHISYSLSGNCPKKDSLHYTIVRTLPSFVSNDYFLCSVFCREWRACGENTTIATTCMDRSGDSMAQVSSQWIPPICCVLKINYSVRCCIFDRQEMFDSKDVIHESEEKDPLSSHSSTNEMAKEMNGWIQKFTDRSH